jgi:hypothetical protein
MPKDKRLRIYLDKKAWAATQKSAKAVRTLPKSGVRMMIIPAADGGADVVPFCHEQGPDTICQVRSTLKPDGSISFECRCRPANTGGGGPSSGGSPTVPSCVLTSSPRLQCLKFGCKGRCELVLVQRPVLGKILFFAACRCR